MPFKKVLIYCPNANQVHTSCAKWIEPMAHIQLQAKQFQTQSKASPHEGGKTILNVVNIWCRSTIFQGLYCTTTTTNYTNVLEPSSFAFGKQEDGYYYYSLFFFSVRYCCRRGRFFSSSKVYELAERETHENYCPRSVHYSCLTGELGLRCLFKFALDMVEFL